jgi:ubiquinone/menaquinone biosynthesis C-methylase UbiE
MSGFSGFFVGTEMPDDYWEALWPDPAGVLSASGLQPGVNAVDLCCGDGWFTLPMAKTARHVTAIDIDARLLAMVRTRLEKQSVANCDIVEGDAYDLPKFVKTPADFVFLANVYHGVPDKPRLVRAAAAVLTPGGLLAVVNWHARRREETPVLGQPRGPKTELRMTPEQTIESAKSAEMKFLRVVEVPPYHYAVIWERSA